MSSKKRQIRNELKKAMASAYCQHLDEAAENPAMKKETWDDFFSPYFPVADDDDLIEFFARRASGITQDALENETDDSGH